MTELDVQNLRNFTRYIEETYEPYEGGGHFETGTSQWMGWNLNSVENSILSNIIVKVKNTFRTMLYNEAVDSDKHKVLGAFEYLVENFPIFSTLHLYRQGTDDGTGVHADTYNIFGIAIITLQESDNGLVVERRGTLQQIGPRDIQFIAPNNRDSVPRGYRLYNRKSLTFTF